MKSWVSKMHYEDHGRFKKYKKYIIFFAKTNMEHYQQYS